MSGKNTTVIICSICVIVALLMLSANIFLGSCFPSVIIAMFLSFVFTALIHLYLGGIQATAIAKNNSLLSKLPNWAVKFTGPTAAFIVLMLILYWILPSFCHKDELNLQEGSGDRIEVKRGNMVIGYIKNNFMTISQFIQKGTILKLQRSNDGNIYVVTTGTNDSASIKLGIIKPETLDLGTLGLDKEFDLNVPLKNTDKIDVAIHEKEDSVIGHIDIREIDLKELKNHINIEIKALAKKTLKSTDREFRDPAFPFDINFKEFSYTSQGTVFSVIDTENKKDTEHYIKHRGAKVIFFNNEFFIISVVTINLDKEKLPKDHFVDMSIYKLTFPPVSTEH